MCNGTSRILRRTRRRQRSNASYNWRITNRNHNAMGASITGVVVAGCFSVLVALIHAMRKENRKDHGEVHSALGRIEQKIDGHTENHK
jgi:hypothetical protein